jgi:hypothetical protein
MNRPYGFGSACRGNCGKSLDAQRAADSSPALRGGKKTIPFILTVGAGCLVPWQALKISLPSQEGIKKRVRGKNFKHLWLGFSVKFR